MARRSPKRGVFTGSQFEALRGIGHQCRALLRTIRTRNITMKKSELMPLFIKEEHHQLLRDAAAICSKLNSSSSYLYCLTRSSYDSLSKGGNEIVGADVRFIVNSDVRDFLIPDYADGRYPSNGVPKVLPPHLQNYVDMRLSLAVEFGLLETMLIWFADERLYVPQMAYLFPPIMQMLSASPVTKELASKYAKAPMPSHVPTPPGMREAFSIVESTVMKTLMMLGEPRPPEDKREVSLDVRFPNPGIKFMGWDINLN